jgi:hypothetical protein
VPIGGEGQRERNPWPVHRTSEEIVENQPSEHGHQPTALDAETVTYVVGLRPCPVQGHARYMPGTCPVHGYMPGAMGARRSGYNGYNEYRVSLDDPFRHGMYIEPECILDQYSTYVCTYVCTYTTYAYVHT